MSESTLENIVVQISPWWFIGGCAAIALGVLTFGRVTSIPSWIIATEVLITIISLFVFGSTRYQLDKNALTYGAVMVIGATFATGWWPESTLKLSLQTEGISALWNFFARYFLSLHGLDELFHADTMLFILGLTFFVAVIAQTRILESVSFAILKKNKGRILPTIAILTALVSAASGVLDGVSMIGLMIRTLVIILFLAKAKEEAVLYSVIISTVITTVCGMWLAYGEPPNLIMKANLHPFLTNAFFLRYCLPVAIGTYVIVYLNLRYRLKGQKVKMETLDILDMQTADVRFLQASRHGKVLSPIEFIEERKDIIGSNFDAIFRQLHRGVPLGEAMVLEKISPQTRKKLLGEFISVDLAETLDQHYVDLASSNGHDSTHALSKITAALERTQKKRIRAQQIGALSFIPFVALLIAHAVNHHIPLFLASMAGFVVALAGIYSISKIRKLAIHEALHEYKEYLFLFPLFLSITLLQKSGFFDQMSVWIHHGIESLGTSLIALIQFTGAVFLSALLDNNVVADFASRALHGLELNVLHLFAMAQIAGYAVGGCWTHIGSAQSVVAYSFIRKEINPRYTPFQWIKLITPLILEIFALMVVVIYAEHFFLD
jgi:hypothetical protein